MPAEASKCSAGTKHAAQASCTASMRPSMDNQCLGLDSKQAPPTPKWTKVAGPFLKLAACAAEECSGQVMGSPPATMAPFTLLSPSGASAQLSSSSTSRKKIVARRITAEQSQQQPAPPARSATAALHSAKQQQQQQCQAMLEAACKSIALDNSFLGPQLTIRTPRPRISGITPEDCFSPSATASLIQLSPRGGSGNSTPSSLLASQLQACLSSLDALEQHCRGTPSRMFSSASHVCMTPSRCCARVSSEDLDSCVVGSSGSMTRLCK